MKPVLFCWPEGKRAALTFSWDDGTIYDRKLIGLFNQHGLKGSFYLNSAKLGLSAAQSGWKAYVEPSEVKALYTGHEVGSHTLNHPFPSEVSAERLRHEFLEDRRALERLVGYPIRGAVVPFGYFSGMEPTCATLASLGFAYVRDCRQTNRHLEIPASFLPWVTTDHCSVDLDALWEKSLHSMKASHSRLLYIWGHSYEFDEKGDWDRIERFASKAGANPSVWHATNGQVYDYVCAWRSLAWNLDGDCVYNPSAQSVYFHCQGQYFHVSAGQTLRF